MYYRRSLQPFDFLVQRSVDTNTEDLSESGKLLEQSEAAATATDIANNRPTLIENRSDLDLRTVEQHSFVSSMKYLTTTTYMSTVATMDAIIRLFSPDVHGVHKVFQ